MKKILLFMFLVALSTASFAQDAVIKLNAQTSKTEIIEKSFTGLSLVYSYDKIDAYTVETERGEFSSLSMENTYMSGINGNPQLVVDRKMIAIPLGATPKVNVISYTEEEYNLNDYGVNRIYPRQPSVSKSTKLEDIKFVYNEDAYNSRSYTNEPLASVEVSGKLRGMRFGFINIQPISYNPSTNTIKVKNNIVVEVTFENGDRAATQSLFENTYSPYFEPLYKNAINRDIYDEHPDMLNYPVHMLVIANRMFEDVMQPWIEWKTKKGFYLDVNYTDDIGTSYSQIKNFVHNKYNEALAAGNPPSFLILFGDVPQVPNTSGTTTGRVTDLYYSSVDGDYFPDMFCSRLSCETPQEMANVIEKTLVYEQYTMADPSYLNNVLLIAGGDNYWNPKVGQPTIKYGIQNYFNEEHGFENVNYYLTNYTGCYENLNTGVAFANYTAHGGYTSWSTPQFTVGDIQNLTNLDKYFLAIGNCCIAADFGYSSVCFGEAMIRAEKKGAFAYIGSAPSSYWYEDWYWSVGAHQTPFGQVPPVDGSTIGAYDGMFMNETYNTVGSTLLCGNLAVSYAHLNNYSVHVDEGDIYYWEAYHVLGDASVIPYVTEPTQNDVSHLPVIHIGVNSYNVTAEPGSYVCISRNGEIFGTGYVGTSGNQDIEITPIATTGNVDIVVTCPQKIPYVTQVPAVALEGAFLSVFDVILGGDGILSYGETTDLSLVIKNVGVDPSIGNSQVTITCDDPAITIINGTATCPSLDPEATVNVSGFKFKVSEDIDNGTSFKFEVEIVNGNQTYNGSFNITAYKPVLEYVGNNWPGQFEAGQTLSISVTYKNTGGYTVSNVIANLETETTDVTINPETVSLGTIAPNGSGTATFTVQIGTEVDVNEPILFTTQATGDNGAIMANGEFTIANQCGVLFTLKDSYGDGWNGNAKLVVSFDDGSPTQELKLVSGFLKEEILNIAKGTLVTLSWIKGSWDQEISFTVAYENCPDSIIYSVTHPTQGELFSFVNTCCIGGEDELDPIVNLVLTEEKPNVILTWEYNNDADMFIISRNGLTLDTVNASKNVKAAFSYTDENVPSGEHTYCVVVEKDGSQSIPVCAQITVEEDLCTPVQNLTAVNDGNNVITLNWDYPEGYNPGGSGETHELTWAGPADDNAIGTASAADFDVANRFEVSDLTNYVGWTLKTIKFYPAEQQCEYSLRAWTGDNAADLVLDQVVANPIIGGETVIDVESDVVIEPGKEFWIGYRCNTQTGYPAGVDAGPAVEGKGDMIFFDGAWAGIGGMGLNYNFVIIGVIQNAKGETANLVLNDNTNRPSTGMLSVNYSPIVRAPEATRGLEGYKILLEGESIGMVNDPNVTTFEHTYTFTNKLDVEYCVKAVYTNCESESVCATVTVMDAIEDNADISVYPNPANNIVNIAGVNVDVIYIYNNIGQLVDQVRSNQVDVSNYASGLYMFNIISKDGTMSKVKIAVNR